MVQQLNSILVPPPSGSDLGNTRRVSLLRFSWDYAAVYAHFVQFFST